MKYRLVIFDWDGTLMDSTGRIVDCMRRAAVDLALPSLTPEAVRHIIGLGLPEAIRTLYPDIDDAGVSAMRARYAEHFVAAEVEPSRFYPGVESTLARIRDESLLMAVATGKSRKGLDRVWRGTGAGHWFHASRCADESGSKPDPAMVVELLEELKVEPHEAVLVGDTTFDLDMARAAGVDAVGVGYGAHPPEKLRATSPLAILDAVHELLPLLGLGEPDLESETV